MSYKIQNYIPIFLKEDGDFFILEDKKIISNLIKNLRNKFSNNEILKELKISKRTFYYYIERKRKPSLKTIHKIALLVKDPKIMDRLYNNFKKIYTRGHSGHNMPRFYSKELAYLAGLICGDGHVSKRTEVYIYNESKKDLNTLIKEYIKKIFNYEPKIRNFETYGRIDISSRTINLLFSKVIGIPKGKKKGRLKIPEFIRLSKEYKVQFLRGLFDSDGGITIAKNGSKNILYSSSDKEFLYQIQKLLYEFNISLPGPYESGNRKGGEIRSFSRPQISKFNKRIGSNHPERMKRLALVA